MADTPSDSGTGEPLPPPGGRNGHRGDKRGPMPGIWSAKDRPGPAAWRRESGHVSGQIRRKGERDPKKGGLRMSKEMAGTPKYANRPGLPPLSPEAKQKMQEQKDAAAEKEREKAKKAAKKAQGAADDNKKSDKVCQAM